ncbi:hypothetical protein [Bacteroides sp.]|nr:hypothetical protein [Bacteroides sp.]MDD3036987.1 hypothetical protein [Bacteroides sp.]
MEHLIKSVAQIIAKPIQHKKATITFAPGKTALSRAPAINFSNYILDY